MKTQKFEIVKAQSNIDWVGKKITGAHNGTIDVKKGDLFLNDGKVNSGNIVIDTTSIKILDITDPATNAQFFGHLPRMTSYLLKNILKHFWTSHQLRTIMLKVT